MILYAVQDSTGNYWDFDNRRFYSPCNNARRNTTFNLDVADAVAKISGGHVVELVDAPEKIAVSEDEADMLEQAKDDYCAASVISAYSTEHIGAMGQDRLVRAYVIGWTVEKPKHYVLPMEGTKLADGTIAYATLDHTGVWTIKGYAEKQSAITFGSTVTKADIDAAPGWVKAITPVDVCADNARTTGEVKD